MQGFRVTVSWASAFAPVRYRDQARREGLQISRWRTTLEEILVWLLRVKILLEVPFRLGALGEAETRPK